jgi:hypothetical protein
MCRVCEHPILAEIEAELVSCAAPDWRMLRRKYGVHHLALMTHKREHVTVPPAKAGGFPLQPVVPAARIRGALQVAPTCDVARGVRIRMHGTAGCTGETITLTNTRSPTLRAVLARAVGMEGFVPEG